MCGRGVYRTRTCMRTIHLLYDDMNVDACPFVYNRTLFRLFIFIFLFKLFKKKEKKIHAYFNYGDPHC